jgi:6-phosphogluconolactonase
MDIILLSMGEDGHIASLFPCCPELHEASRKVVLVTDSRLTNRRLTITPPIIEKAHYVFIMALGNQKSAVYKAALSEPSNIDGIPARLVLNRTWIFGD